MNVIEYLKNEQTKDQVANLIKENLFLYQGINTEQKLDSFTGILYNMFVKECVQNNQYISLSNESIQKITNQYRCLINQLKNLETKNFDAIKFIVASHRNELINIISENKYSESTNQIIVPCAEYTDEFQFSILHLDKIKLMEPIIDVGCGKNCALINLLKSNGYKEVFGIDQYETTEDNILTCNWFEYEFLDNSFGTILSHMAFSNHFRRSIINNDRKLKIYEEKYFEILKSLKHNGLFIYVPALSIIENRIDRNSYSVERYKNAAEKEFDTVIIKRL